MRRELVKISGMACPACAKGIERAVEGLRGVARAAVVFDRGELELNYDERVLPGLAMRDAVAGIARGVAEETRRMSANVPLTGLGCTTRASRVIEDLEKMSGVISASVDMKSKRLSVTFDPAIINYAGIKSAIGCAR
ncbi:MAG: cation transporter [Synergistaceae bacterium]|jgi:copper chaperone CopZ|nr:cation transporter [Synergistaceae bacterium]